MEYKKHRITVVTDSILLPGGEGTNEAATDLDLPGDFGFTLVKSVQELTEIDEIKRSGALGFALPMTVKNDKLLERFLSPAIIDNLYEPVPVEVWVNNNRLEFDRLRVLGVNDLENYYEVEIIDSKEHWIELAKTRKLNSFDFGEFTFSIVNVELNQEFNTRWEPGDDLIWCPLIDTGGVAGSRIFMQSDVNLSANTITVKTHGLTIGSTVKMQITSTGDLPNPFSDKNTYLFEVVDADTIKPIYEDLTTINITSGGSGVNTLTLNNWKVIDIRPLFSIVGLLKTCFLELEYNIGGELLDSEWAQRLWAYILDPKFANNSGNRQYLFASVNKGADQLPAPSSIVNEIITFGTVIQDDSSAWGTASANTYQNTTDEKLRVKISAVIRLENLVASTTNVVLSVFGYNGGYGPVLYEIDVELAPSETKIATFEKSVTLEPGGYLWVSVRTPPGHPIYVKAGSSLFIEPEDIKGIVKNATITLNELINPDYTLFDLLAGFLHLGDFKISTDPQTKTISIYPPEITDVHGTEVEGFLYPTTDVKDKTASIERNSRIIETKQPEITRYVRLQFKDSSDAYIKERLQTTEEEPLHGRTIDLGDKFEEETTVFENPFFEPTAEKLTGGVSVPVMWDNADGRRSYNIKPRILYSFGWVEQQAINEANDSLYRFHGTEKTFLPYAVHVTDLTLNNGSGDDYTTDKNVIYGESDTDLYNTFHSTGLRVRFGLPEFSFLVRLSLDEYLAEDFRRRWYINYKGEGYIYRLIKLLDHETNKDGSTNAVLVPEPNSTT